ncbi:MAG: hypothetical protein AAFR22_08205, partial [Chloroflexota bacterium]
MLEPDVLLTGSDDERAFRLEYLLVAFGGAFMSISIIMLALTRGVRAGDWATLAVWSLCCVMGAWVLEKRLPDYDRLIFAITMVLTGWGLVVIDRLSDGFIYNFADRQTLWMVLGVALMLLVTIRPEPLRWLREYRYLMLIFGLVLLVST